MFFLHIKSSIFQNFVYSVTPSAQAGHKFLAACDAVALYNSPTNNLGQFQCGWNLSTYFSKQWCILSGVCVETLPNPLGDSGHNLISFSKCSLT